MRQQIFRRGFSDAESDKLARREGWEVLLGVVPWSVGGLGFASGHDQQQQQQQGNMEKRRKEREEVRQGRRQVYEALKNKWRTEFREGGRAGDGAGREAWKEEWHRIDVRPLSIVPCPMSLFPFLFSLLWPKAK